MSTAINETEKKNNTNSRDITKVAAVRKATTQLIDYNLRTATGFILENFDIGVLDIFLSP